MTVPGAQDHYHGDSMPEAQAVAVGGGRIVAVGSMESLRPWMDRYYYDVDDRLADKILMPGFIDPHVHPSLPAVLTQFPFLAPDDWSLPTGKFPGAITPEAFGDWTGFRRGPSRLERSVHCLGLSPPVAWRTQQGGPFHPLS
ncbi:MAG: hypothetical protein R2851_23860 [Caldilineaceae bacterium]